MKQDTFVESAPFSLLDWAKTNTHLPGLCETDSISYPIEGSKGLEQMEENHFWFTSRRQIILKLLKRVLPEGGFGLDIGCGSGFNATWLSEQSYPTLGVDAHQIRRAVGDKGLGFLQGDIFSIQPNPEFDFVCLLDVIEHIEDHQRFLDQALKFLKPNGVALITVPAFMTLWSPIDTMSGHYRRYTKSTMSSLVQSVNAQIDKQFYFYGTILPLYVLSRLMTRLRPAEKVSSVETVPSKPINRLMQWMLSMEQRLLPVGGLPFGSSLFVTVRRKL